MTDIESRSAVVLIIDGLSARHLGPYANTWFETPSFDRLAAQSLLAEHAFVDCPGLDASCRSFWMGAPQFDRSNAGLETDGVLDELVQNDREIVLVTDDPDVAGLEQASLFDRVVIHENESTGEIARDLMQTGMAGLFATASTEIEGQSGGSLLWIHSRGLMGGWDAPYEARAKFASDDDPKPPDFVVPPSLFSEDEIDPDVVLGFQQAYAAQVELLDAFLGILLDQIDGKRERQPLFLLSALRGFPMGSGGFVGRPEKSLFDDSLHVPLFVRWPDRSHALLRSQKLAYASSSIRLVSDWMLNEERFDRKALLNPLADLTSELIFSETEFADCLRTHGWKLLTGGDGVQRLFVKPDDRWEANDVLGKCRRIAAELDLLRRQVRQRIEAGDSIDIGEISAELSSSS